MLIVGISPISGQTNVGNIPVSDPIQTIKHSVMDSDGDVYISGETKNSHGYVAKYDKNGNLLWHELFGGKGITTIKDLVLDHSENVITLGLTTSNNFEVSENARQTYFGGGVDLFVKKWNSNGEIIFSTFHGGSGDEFILPWTNDILIDKNDSIIIWGMTKSPDFPILNAFQNTYNGISGPEINSGDIFFSKLDASGVLNWSTYYGSFDQGQWADVVLDKNEDIVVNCVAGPDLQVKNAFQNDFGGGAFDNCYAKISNEGQLIWSTYLGGQSQEYEGNLFIDSNNNILTVGNTYSQDFPIQNWAQGKNNGNTDLFISKFMSDGTIQWSTYFGGSGYDAPDTALKPDNLTLGELFRESWYTTELDKNDATIILTLSRSSDIELSNPFDATQAPMPTRDDPKGDKPLLVKLDKNGNFTFSTFLGSSRNSNIQDLLIDSDNNIIVSGTTAGTDIVTYEASQTENKGEKDVYITKLSPEGDPIFSTYFGGTSTDEVIRTSLDSNDNIILIGRTQSNDLQITAEGSLYSGGNDLFIAKFNKYGILMWSTYVGSDGNEDINRLGITIYSDGGIIIFGTSTTTDILGNQTDSVQAGSYVISYDNQGKVLWSSYLDPSSKIYIPPKDNSNFTRNLVIIISASLIVGIFTSLRYFKARKLAKIILNREMEEILNPLFNNTPSMIYLLAGNIKFKDDLLNYAFQGEIPKEIYGYKFYLNPIRLSILKLLSQETYLTTVEIKERLELPWHTVTNHLNSLKNYGSIIVEQKFVEHEVKSVVSITPSALAEYSMLREILMEFFNAPNHEQYTENSKNVKNDDNELYPQ